MLLAMKYSICCCFFLLAGGGGGGGGGGGEELLFSGVFVSSVSFVGLLVCSVFVCWLLCSLLSVFLVSLFAVF